jgi:hypothetical protein
MGFAAISRLDGGVLRRVTERKARTEAGKPLEDVMKPPFRNRILFVFGMIAAPLAVQRGGAFAIADPPPDGPSQSHKLQERPASQRSQPRPEETPLGMKFAGSAVPVRVYVNQYRNCFAVAPANWSIYGDRREGDALDIGAPEGMGAGYLAVGIPGFMVSAYPDRGATPEIYIQNMISSRNRYRVSYGQQIRDPLGYTWLSYELENTKGVVVYRAWSIPGDPLGYILVSRIAATVKSLWERQGAQAVAVALSIRCTRQLQPSSGGDVRGGTEEDKMESTYNQQLGMEYAHDAATGENYWVSPSSDWHDDGPQGPGYYKRSGNELRKLAPGRRD